MHCTNCGNSIEDASRFCSNCGTPVASNSIPEMSQPTYCFAVTGEIVDGQTLDAVKFNLEKLIKLDRKTLDRIFARKNVVLKKNIDKETAEKYKKAFTKCGAISKITENVTNIITNDKSKDSNSQPHQTKSNVPESQDPENHSESTTTKENHSKINPGDTNAAASWCNSVAPKLGAYLHSKSWSKSLGIGTACLFALIVVFSITAYYWDSSTGSTDCDLLAANPNDNSKVAAGVEWEELVVEKAVMACKNAVKEYPSSARLMYQYGRALDKGKLYDTALKWYRKAADEGHVYAMLRLGVTYANGDIVEKDVAEALKWYRKAADEGSVDALYHLGVIYQDNEFGEKDIAQALKWFRKAANKGDEESKASVVRLEAIAKAENIARIEAIAQAKANASKKAKKETSSSSISQAKQLPTDINDIKALAEQGNQNAQNELGIKYLSGEGVQKNRKTGAYWIEEAAKQGHIEAQNRLGKLYRHGVGVEKNTKTGMNWHRKASDQGYESASYLLGLIYEEGEGDEIKKDLQTAVFWYRKATSQGSYWAEKKLTEYGIVNTNQDYPTQYANIALELMTTNGHCINFHNMVKKIASSGSPENVRIAQIDKIVDAADRARCLQK
jgi:TPR repeat protein